MGLAVAIPAIMSVASAAASTAGGMMQAGAAKSSAKADSIRAKARADSLKVAAEAGRVRALQTDAAYRDQLNQAMQNLTAIKAAQNTSTVSATSMALDDEARRRSDLARKIAVSNENIKAIDAEKGVNSAETDAELVKLGGRNAYTAALIGAAPSILSAGQKVFNAFDQARR